jgi:major outer sheath protein
MKKYLLVSLTILFAAAFVWAQDATTVEPTVDIEAEAKISWGVDLGKGGVKNGAKHGFNNEASWTVKFPLLKKANKTSAKSDVPVYGEVVLKDVALNIQSSDGKNSGKFGVEGKVGGIAAKFVFYGAYITAYDKPSFKSNFANMWDPLLTNKKYSKSVAKFEPGFEGYGFKLGYANKDFMDLDVGVKFGSNGNWDSEVSAGTSYTIKYFDGNTKLGGDEYILMDVNGNPTWVNNKHPIWNGESDVYPEEGSYAYYKTTKAKDNHSEYGIGFDLAMKPLDKMLGLAFTVNSTLVQSDKYNEGVAGVEDDKVAFSVGAEVTSEPVDGLKLKLGFDGGMNFKTGNKNVATLNPINAFAWDMLFDAQYKWIGVGVYVSSPGTKFAGTNLKQGHSVAEEKITDLSFYAKLETNGDKKKASNLVEGLDAGVYLGFPHLLTAATAPSGSKAQIPFVGKIWGAYKASINDSMWIKPYANFWLNTNHSYGTGKDPKVGLAYDLGLTFSPVEKVEFDAKWTQGTLKKNNFASVVSRSAIEQQHKGRFVLSLKLTY